MLKNIGIAISAAFILVTNSKLHYFIQFVLITLWYSPFQTLYKYVGYGQYLLYLLGITFLYILSVTYKEANKEAHISRKHKNIAGIWSLVMIILRFVSPYITYRLLF